jgi:hypothetical protein
MFSLTRILILFSFIFLNSLFSNQRSWSSPLSSSFLYTQDIEKEKQSEFVEVVLLEPFVPPTQDFHSLIFNARLSQEFKQQYKEQFQTQWQNSEISLHDMFNAYNHRVLNESWRRHLFAQYVIKRLGEYHFDEFIRSDPSMRPLYEAKEKLQNVELKVNQQTRFLVQYSLSGNFLDLKIDSPYFEESKITYRMNPNHFGPSTVLAREYRLTKAVTQKNKFQLLYEEQLQSWGFFLIQQRTSYINTFFGFHKTEKIQSLSSLSSIEIWAQQHLLRTLDPYRLQIGLGWSF